MIIGANIYAMVAFFRIRSHITTLKTRVGFSAIMVGLSLVALFYLADLIEMHILPFVLPMAEAMEVMKDLHLNQRWWISLVSIGAIAFGLSSASQGVFALIEDLKSTQIELQHELKSRRETERALRESENSLKRAQKLGRIGHWRWSIEDDRLISCSEEYARIHGVGIDDIHDLMAKQMDCVIHPEDRNRATAEFKRFDEEGLGYEIEYRIIRADGAVRHILEICEVVITGPDRAVEQIGTVQDITDQKNREETIRCQAERFRDIYNESPVSIWEQDWSDIKQLLDQISMQTDMDLLSYFEQHPDQLCRAYDLTKTVDFSKETARIYRAETKSDARRLAEVNSETADPDELAGTRDAICSIYEGNLHHEYEAEETAYDGSKIITRVRHVLPSKHTGSWSRVLVSIEDITQRKRAEEALQQSESRLNSIMENAPVEIYLKDVEGRYLLINRHYEMLWGVANEAVRGKLPADVHQQKEFADAARSHDLEVMGSKKAIEREQEVRMEDGLHTLRMVKFPIHGAAGEITGLGAIATNVTESKKIQQIKDEFISSVSHELRTPMTSVVGALGLVKGGAAGRLPEKAQSMIEIAHKNCNRLVRLLNDILDIEKIESGKANFEIVPLELGPLVRDSLETVAAYADGHDVAVRLVEDLHPVRVKGDADRLVQVLINLLSNAIKFSPRGSAVELRISRDNHFVRLSVTDHGPGIPEAFRGCVFERFTQADTTDSRSRSGSGLGLSICKLIIDGLGGKIAFDTEIGRGTTFYIELTECADAEELAGDVTTAAVGDDAASHSIDRTWSPRLKSQSGRRGE